MKDIITIDGPSGQTEGHFPDIPPTFSNNPVNLSLFGSSLITICASTASAIFFVSL